MACPICSGHHFKMILDTNYPQHYRDFIISLIDIYR